MTYQIIYHYKNDKAYFLRPYPSLNPFIFHSFIKTQRFNKIILFEPLIFFHALLLK